MTSDNDVTSEEMSALSSQEQLLVGSYLNCMNKSQAAKEAGYTSTGPLNKPAVKAAINAQLAGRASRLVIRGDWVLRQLVAVLERTMASTKVIDADGFTGQYEFDATNSLKALALIGKHVDVQAFDSKESPNDAADAQGLIERLQRGRQRMNDTEKGVSFF